MPFIVIITQGRLHFFGKTRALTKNNRIVIFIINRTLNSTRPIIIISLRNRNNHAAIAILKIVRAKEFFTSLIIHPILPSGKFFASVILFSRLNTINKAINMLLQNLLYLNRLPSRSAIFARRHITLIENNAFAASCEYRRKLIPKSFWLCFIILYIRNKFMPDCFYCLRKILNTLNKRSFEQAFTIVIKAIKNPKLYYILSLLTGKSLIR